MILRAGPNILKFLTLFSYRFKLNIENITWVNKFGSHSMTTLYRGVLLGGCTVYMDSSSYGNNFLETQKGVQINFHK